MLQQYDIKYIQQFSKPTVERLTNIAKLVDAGILTVHLDKVFPRSSSRSSRIPKNRPSSLQVVLQIKQDK